jgi:hypothetical protein
MRSGWVGWAVMAGLTAAGAGRAMGGDGRGPPPAPPVEAVQACSDQQENASCSFTLDGRTIAGTCRSGPQGEAPACVPARPPHGPPPEAFEACSGQQEGAPCTVALGGTELAGTCRQGPDGGAVACAPSEPPPQR